jgi:hypothetical protein
MTLGMPPADNAPAELAYVFHIEGVHTIDDFAQRTSREDNFTVTVAIHAGQDGQDDTTAAARVEQIFSWFENAVADSDGDLGNLDGLRSAQISRVQGPNLVGTNTGYLGYIDFDLACVADYA